MCIDDFEKVRDFVYRCKHCGQEVESGIINISKHWCECVGKEFYESMIANPPKTLEDVENLQKKHLKQLNS